MFEQNQKTLEIIKVIIHVSDNDRLAMTMEEADEARVKSHDAQARLLFTGIVLLANAEHDRRDKGGLADLTVPADILASLLIMSDRTLITMLEICAEHVGSMPGRKVALRKAVAEIIKRRKPAPPAVVDVRQMLTKNVSAPIMALAVERDTFTSQELDYLGRAVCYYPDTNWEDHQMGDTLVAKLGALLRGTWLT